MQTTKSDPKKLSKRPAASSLMIGRLVDRYRHLETEHSGSGAEILDEILKRTYDRLLAIARSAASKAGQCDAEELLQEAWVERIQAALMPGRREIVDSSHYFALTAKSVFQTFHDIGRRNRAKKRGAELRRVVGGEMTGQGAPGDTRTAEFWLDFEAAAALLTPAERDVFLEQIVRGASRADTAKVLGLREHEVRALLASAKSHLAACLADYDEGHPANAVKFRVATQT